MSKLRILYVASEINPFLQTSKVADFVRHLPQAMQERGMEIRILVPRFGTINERKNRLHEVVRLSGINISIGDEEKPLVIKVASIPNAKLQVYFIDNQELEQLYIDIPKFERFFRILAQNRFIALEERINGELSASAEERYLALLDRYPTLPQRVPQQYIASFLGIQPPSLSRIRKQLANRKKG